MYKIIKKNYKRMNLLKYLKMSRLNFNFVMIYIIHKMLVLLKNHLDFLKVIFGNAFLRSIIDLQVFLKKYSFHNI